MCLVGVNAFLFMWGVPYMTSLGIGSAEVGTLLTINVVIMVALGPLIGVVTGRFPRRRPLLGWIAGSVLTMTWAVTLLVPGPMTAWQDRKSTRLNSSHVAISYAVFCLKKKISNYI